MWTAQKYKVGVILYVRASLVSNAAENHRLYGSKAKAMWLPGRVTLCKEVETLSGRKSKRVAVQWFIWEQGRTR
jgi:hypothetical protein